ncbi:MAG: glycosyltransferase family 2 protein [Betaproteobacteria bacterium]|nr:glycosyltransferase family 2 protein [Betaproteobacteria bacterium]
MTPPSKLPFITVIIPVRNEEGHITVCLNSILECSYPAGLLEILVVDGLSDDRTRSIVMGFCARYPSVRMLDNPARVVPNAMNIGIRASRGELVIRMDAHANYKPDYLLLLVKWMAQLGADNVGGVVVTRPASESAEARAVAVILSHPFGVGNSQFRLTGLHSPVEVDTVPFGCYRREIFDRIGLYDEMFVRNQDDELNARLRKSGGRIFLIPEIEIDYIARESLRQLARMFYQYGYFKPLVAIKLGGPATWRQLVPPAFTSALIVLPAAAWFVPESAVLWGIVLAAHATINAWVSASQGRRHGWRLFPYLFCGFLLAHVTYGAGYLKGSVDFGLRRGHLKKRKRDAPLSR